MCVMVYLMCYIDENLTCFTKRSRKKKIWQNSWHESESVEIVIWCSFGSLRWWTKCELIKSGNLRFQDPLGSLLFVSTHKLCVTFVCVWSHNSSVESAHAYKRIWWYSFVSTKPIYRVFMMWCDIRAVPSPIATIPVNNVKNLTRTYHIRSWIHILR